MASHGSYLIFLLAIGLQLYVSDVTSWSFSQVSEPIEITGYTGGDGTFSVICQADTPLVKCQFNNFDWDETRITDLSRGANSGETTMWYDAQYWFGYFNVTYNGRGLEQGQCGATYSNIDHRVRSPIFGCRGADMYGEWHDLDLSTIGHVFNRHLISASINPRRIVTQPGSDVSVLLKTNATMESCKMSLGRDYKLQYFDYEGFLEMPDHYRYFGTTPLQGDCGLTVINVTEADNGIMMHYGWTTEDKMSFGVSRIIVASPPFKTYFNVDRLSYSVGDTLNATCSSLLSRPVANLTWTLDDRIIRQDGIDDEFQEDVWSWPWDKKNITQKLSIILEEEHFGKTLECHITHLEMTESQAQLHYIITNKMSIAQTTLWVICVVCFVFVVVLLTVVAVRNHHC